MSGDNDGANMVKLSVPGTLAYRDLVLRAVASMCRLVRLEQEQEPSHGELEPNFDDKIVSAVGEAFNNIALHAYSRSHRGDVDVEFEYDRGEMTIRLFDTGESFDPSTERGPDLAGLPESHMGLYIIGQCMDEVTYERGVSPLPNVLTLTKRCFRPAGRSDRRNGTR